jgi:lipopolysaccharide export LptBFGC system permease protein LptF
MSIPELRSVIANTKPINPDAVKLRAEAQIMLQNNFAIPSACFVLALVALALGVSNRKDGMLASFAIGFIVVFVFYVLMFGARSIAMGGRLSGTIAPWISVAAIGLTGVVLTIWRAKSTDRPRFIAWIMKFARRGDSEENDAPKNAGAAIFPRAPLTLPGIRILDMYTSRQYMQVFFLSIFSALGIFYISTFIDMSDKLFKGQTTAAMLGQYFYYQTPQFVFFIIPLTILIAGMVTNGT